MSGRGFSLFHRLTIIHDESDLIMSSKHASHTRLSGVMTLLGLLLAVGMSGCNTLNVNAPYAKEKQAVKGPQYRVHLSPAFGRSWEHIGQIDGQVTVQDALEASGATRKFRAMDISLSRKVDGSAKILRLPVEYNVASKTVVDHLNYALHPGDTLSVRARASGSLDKLVDSLILK